MDFEEICRAMANPAFYPHSVSRIERRDTHISAVFLTGDWVYKLKKPVDFGFLDFTTLEARRHFCEQEVLLNKRLSRGVYEGVVEVRLDAEGRPTLQGSGEVVEYAVKMVQLPDEASLKSLLEGEKIDVQEMKKLGRHLANFYDRSEQSPEIDRYGSPETIGFNMEENFHQIAPFVDELVNREKWEFIRQVSRAFFENWQDLFTHRVELRRIRDGHGDLRAEHIYFFNGLQIIDCIEFNDRFRYGDVVVDLAFLHTDMEYLGRPDLSRAILSAYVDHADDPELYTLIDFYAAYRAVVKLKVTCLRSTEMEARERDSLKGEVYRYLQQAYRYALQFSRPTLWIFCGLPATGKSALAKQVAGDLSQPIFQSDRLRQSWTGCPMGEPGVVPYAQGLYRPEMRQKVYAHMLACAQEQLKSGRSVILDASFSARKWRDEARQLAADLDTNFICVECVSKEETIRKRLLQREDVAGPSDARIHHLPKMKKDFEPPTEIPPQSLIVADTDRPFPQVLSHVLSEAYARKCEQVAGLVNGESRE